MADMIVSPTQAWKAAGQRITNVADATASTDAVTLRQLYGAPNGLAVWVTVGSTLNGTKGQYTCDGIADDVEIQAAINYAAANSIAGVFIIAGTYKTTLAIDVPPKMEVRGAGRRSTLIYSDGNNISVFQILGSSGEANYDFDQAIRHLEIRGNANSGDTSNYGLLLKWANGTIIENVYFRQCYYGSIIIDAINSTFKDCIFANSREHGIRISCQSADESAHDILFENCDFDTNFGTGQLAYVYRGTSSVGVSCFLPTDITFKNCRFRDSVQASIRYEGKRLIVDGCKSYNPGFHNYRVSSDGLGGEDCVIVNSYGTGAGQNGLYFDNDYQTITNLVVKNTRIRNSAQQGVAMQGAIDYLFDKVTISNSGFGSGGTTYDGFYINVAASSGVGRNFANLTIRNSKAYDDQGTQTQGYGIGMSNVVGTISNIIVENCNFDNNALGNIESTIIPYITRQTELNGGLRIRVSTANTANPPTDAELDTAFGTPAEVGKGFVALLNDANGGTNEYYVWSDGTNWFYTTGTKAV